MFSPFRPGTLSQIAKTTLPKVNKIVDAAAMSRLPALSTTSTVGSLLNEGMNRNYGKLGATLVGGTAGGVAYDAAKQGLRLGNKATRLIDGNPVKVNAIGMTRGATRSLIKNRRPIVNTLTGGAVSTAEVANAAVKKGMGQTKIGQFLTKDISTPVIKKLKLKNKLRDLSKGLFSYNFNNLIYI